MAELNLNNIYMDMDELLEKYDGKIGSISDSNEIQQISLFCQNNPSDYRRKVLTDMINPQFAFCGLYPHVLEIHDIIPEKKGFTIESTKDSLPEKDGKYIVFTKTPFGNVNKFETNFHYGKKNKGVWGCNNQIVTHWLKEY